MMENEGGGGLFPELNTDSDITLQQLDLDQLRHDRLERNKAIMQGGHANESPEADAAVCIQRWFRGFRGRKIYAEKLFECFEKEQAEQAEKVMKQMEEGELLVENHQLEVLFDDNKTTRKNQNIHLRYSIITIQRAWRAYLEKKHSAKSIVKEDSDLGKPDSDLGNSNSDLDLQNNIDLNIARSRSSEEENQREVKSKPDNSLNDQISDENAETIDNFGLIERDSDLIFQNPLIDLERFDTNIGQGQICEGQQKLDKEVKVKQTELQKLPDETDHDFNKRVRKHSLLQDAHRFVELKKLDSNILPFDLHKYSDFVDRNNSSSERIDKESGGFANEAAYGQEMAEILTHANEKFSSVVNDNNNCDSHGHNMDTKSPEIEKSVPIKDKLSKDKFEGSKGEGNSVDLMVDSGIQIEAECDTANDSRSSRTADDETIGPFEVYNIETALPNINWETLEESLKQASEEEKQRQEARRNDREEIRKKLAMGFDDDDDVDNENDNDDDESAGYKKPNLQTRLSSGMNLQICFMNESPADTDSDRDLGRSPRQFEESDNVKILPKVSDIVDSDNNLPSVADLNRVTLDPNDRGESSNTTRLKTNTSNSNSTRLKPNIVDDTEDKGFLSHQEQLQNEAKLALAQAGTMAHMQLEIEKQTKKKSPMADIVGIPGLGERRRKKLGLRKLQEMNLAQIQVLYNDLQTQIESLNEDLVKLLMERDELHMEQDSMLVDVEDLTRRAEEIAEKATKTKPKETTTTCTGNSKLKGKLLRR